MSRMPVNRIQTTRNDVTIEVLNTDAEPPGASSIWKPRLTGCQSYRSGAASSRGPNRFSACRRQDGATLRPSNLAAWTWQIPMWSCRSIKATLKCAEHRKMHRRRACCGGLAITVGQDAFARRTSHAAASTCESRSQVSGVRFHESNFG